MTRALRFKSNRSDTRKWVNLPSALLFTANNSRIETDKKMKIDFILLTSNRATGERLVFYPPPRVCSNCIMHRDPIIVYLLSKGIPIYRGIKVVCDWLKPSDWNRTIEINAHIFTPEFSDAFILILAGRRQGTTCESERPILYLYRWR